MNGRIHPQNAKRYKSDSTRMASPFCAFYTRLVTSAVTTTSCFFFSSEVCRYSTFFLNTCSTFRRKKIAWVSIECNNCCYHSKNFPNWTNVLYFMILEHNMPWLRLLLSWWTRFLVIYQKILKGGNYRTEFFLHFIQPCKFRIAHPMGKKLHFPIRLTFWHSTL